MSITDDTMALFLKDPWAGFEALFAAREAQALRALLNAAPMDAVAVAHAQREHSIFRHLRGVRAQVEDFAAAEAARQREKKPGS